MLISCDECFAVRELEEPEALGKLGREERDLRGEIGEVWCLGLGGAVEEVRNGLG